MCRPAPVPPPYSYYYFSEEEARESVNSAYGGPRAWGTGCRSWHNVGVGDGSVGLTFILGPLGQYALVGSGRDEGFLRQSVCCSARGSFRDKPGCVGGCLPELPALARGVKLAGLAWGPWDRALAVTAATLLFLTACLAAVASCVR